MLLVQQTGAQPGDHNDVIARCRLSSTSQVTCLRRQGVYPLDVRWQVVELGEGLRVQALSNNVCATSLALPQPVDAGSAFVLRTLNTTSGGFYDDEDATPFVLASATTVVAPPTSCGGYDVQVVEWGGATVTRGILDGGLPAGVASGALLGLSAAGGNRVVLVQAGMDMDGMANTCSLQLRATTPGPSELAFSRALGDGGCAVNPLPRIAWERIDFGTRATVQERTLLLPAGVALAEAMITAIDPNRTFVFSSNQSTMGQGMGETDSLPFNKPVEAAFAFDFPTPTTLRAVRGRSTGAARVTVYVVQVE
jgi:hypothetical protein